MVSLSKLSRRRMLTLSLGGAATLALSPLAIADTHGSNDKAKKKERPRSIIVLWLDGAPSQLETFDPKPGVRNGGPTKAIDTSIKGVQLAAGLEQTAEQLQYLSLLRALVGKEGDHERATTLMKTGRRPEVNLKHPALGAVCAHELPTAGTEIPRFITLLGRRPVGAGYLGPTYDAFAIDDPNDPVQDVRAPVSAARQTRRNTLLDALEKEYGARQPQLESRTSHRKRITEARRTMASPQLAAFDIDLEPAAVRAAYGDTPFGRGCLIARRLVEVGVRCVEVTLRGWDTHVDNFSACADLVQQLDPALATLVRELRERDMFGSTMVLCTGEFGRTPSVNPAEGRDHWPGGFSALLGGAGLRAGQVLGSTGRDGTKNSGAIEVERLHATTLTALGIDPSVENITPAGRPVKLSDAAPIAELLPS